MSLQRLLGGAAQGVSRRRFLAGAGAAGWCGACAAPVPGKPGSQQPDAKAPAQVYAVETEAEYRLPSQPRLVTVYYFNEHPHDRLDRNAPHGFSIDRGIPRLVHEGISLQKIDESSHDVPAYVKIVALCVRDILEKFTPHRFDTPDLPLKFYLKNLVHFRATLGRTHTYGPEVEVDHSLQGSDLYATIGHEIFHQIQSVHNKHGDWLQYLPKKPDNTRLIYQNELIIRHSILEGTARAFEFVILKAYDRGIDQAADWLLRPGIRLFSLTEERRGELPFLDHARGFFFVYVSEQHAGAQHGTEALRAIVAACAPADGAGKTPLITVDALRAARASLSRPGHFDRLLAVRPPVDERERPVVPHPPFVSPDSDWGNFLVALAMVGGADRDSRFRIRAAARWYLPDGPRLAVPPEHALRLATVPEESPESVPLGPGVMFDPGLLSQANVHQWLRPFLLGPSDVQFGRPGLEPYAFHVWTVSNPDARHELLRLRVTRRDGALRADGTCELLLQVILHDRAGRLHDLVRAVPDHAGKIDRVVSMADVVSATILISANEYAGDFQVTFSRPVDRALLFLTNWNSQIGKHLSLDPHQQRWHWRSPDMHVAERGQLLTLEISNLGTQRAENPRVALYAIRGRDFGKGGAAWHRLDSSRPQLVTGLDTRPFHIETRKLCAELDRNDRLDALRCGRDERERVLRRWPTETLGIPDWPRLPPDGWFLFANVRADNDAQLGGASAVISLTGNAPPIPAGEFFVWPT
jgi:hypothetical protein